MINCILFFLAKPTFLRHLTVTYKLFQNNNITQQNTTESNNF